MFRILTNRSDIAKETPVLLLTIPQLCARSVGLRAGIAIRKRWLLTLLNHSVVVVLYETTNGGTSRGGVIRPGVVSGAAVLLAIGQNRLHAEVLCAANTELYARMQVQVIQQATAMGATGISISFDHKSVALGENMYTLDKLARLIYSYREPLRLVLPNIIQSLRTGIISTIDRDLLFEMMRSNYPVDEPGGGIPHEPWKNGKLEVLVNTINTARKEWMGSGAQQLMQMRASLGGNGVGESLRELVTYDGNNTRKHFEDNHTVHLTREEITNAIVYSLRHVFRAHSPVCNAWVQACLVKGGDAGCNILGAKACDGEKVQSIIGFILRKAEAKGPEAEKMIREKMSVMVDTFWAPGEKDIVSGKYLSMLLEML
jgi:hypothetical protein